MPCRFERGQLRPWVYYCLFGLLSVSGLRLGEARNLELQDVDLKGAVLTIRGTKSGKNRLAAFELAKLQSKKGMIQKLLRHKDPRWTWKLMCNRWPEEFRDRVATEVSGPNGVPLMPQNPFKVEVRLADSEEIQTDFEVEEPDGSISHVH